MIVRDIPENLHIYWSFEYVEEVRRVMCVESFADVAEIFWTVDAAEPFAAYALHAVVTKCRVVV